MLLIISGAAGPLITAGSSCSVVIAMHGCAQTTSDIGMDFVKNVGLNEVAESNNLVILYPQAVHSFELDNPEGCFDWWGYTGSTYATQKGVQMATVQAMAQATMTGAALAGLVMA